MTKQVIDLGTTANSNNGDPLRTAFTKVNANFTELYTLIGSSSGNVIDVVGPLLNHSDHTNVTVTLDSVNDRIVLDAQFSEIIQDLKGSVFADDSSVMVDAVNNKMYADTVTTLAVFGNPTLALNADIIALDAQNGNLTLQTTDTITNNFVNTWEVQGVSASMVLTDDGVNSELGLGIDVVDFGTGNTIDMQNCSVLLTGATVSGNIIPDTDIAYDIGSPTNRFKDIYLSGNTMYLGSAVLQATQSGGLSLPQGSSIPGLTDVKFKPELVIDDRQGQQYYATGAPANATIIDQATWIWSDPAKRYPTFQPSVYAATIDGNGNITDVTLNTANYYTDTSEQWEIINTDNLIALDAGIDITDPAAIRASSYFEVLPAVVQSVGDTVLASAAAPAVSGPIDVTHITNSAGVLNINGDVDFGNAGTIDFTGATISGWSDPDVVNEHGGSAVITIGIQTASMDNLTVRIVENSPGDIDVEFNYDAGATATVSANGDLANRFNGTTTFAAGNTTWTTMNILDVVGDKGEFTIVDHSFHKIYRVTTFAKALPAPGTAGDAYCVIERLK